MTNPLNNPRVAMLATASLIPNLRNARDHTDKQIVQLAANIQRFGFLAPIVVDADNLIAAGHGRWEAAKKLGLPEVPCIRAEFLSDADRRAFALADNKLSELSDWNTELLTEELEFLFEDGFDISSIGFTTADLDVAIVDEKEAKPVKGERVELPDPEQQAVSRAGDLWLIGPNLRLYCGDSRDLASWEALLGDDRATLVFGDGPYNVPIEGFVSGTGRHREFLVGAGEMTPPQFTAFLRSVFRNCVRFSVGGSIHYHCIDWRHLREILDAADGVYDQFKQLLACVKSNGGMGTF